MYTLAGKEDDNNIGCLLSVGILLILTLISLSPLLFSTILAADWYTVVSGITDLFLVIGLIFIFFPYFFDKWTRLMLVFILLSCLILQLSTFSLFSGGIDNYVMPPTWSIYLRVGCAVFLTGFFIFTVNSNFRRLNKTLQNISMTSLSISEKRITIGKEFLIRYLLVCESTTPIKIVHITFVYQQHENFSLYANGYPGYEEHTLPVYEKKDFLINPSIPFTEEIHWTIPASLIPEEGTRKDWTLKVRLVPHKGVTMETTYPLKVKWDWSDQDL